MSGMSGRNSPDLFGNLVTMGKPVSNTMTMEQQRTNLMMEQRILEGQRNQLMEQQRTYKLPPQNTDKMDAFAGLGVFNSAQNSRPNTPMTLPNVSNISPVHSRMASNMSSTSNVIKADAFASLLKSGPSSSNSSPSHAYTPQSIPKPNNVQSPGMAQMKTTHDTWGNLDFLSSKSTQPVDVFDVAFLGSKHEDDILGALSLPVSSLPPPTPLSNPVETFSPPKVPEKVLSSPVKAERIPERIPEKTNEKSDAIAQVISMGFDQESAKTALEMTGYKVNDAIELLLQQHSATKRMSQDQGGRMSQDQGGRISQDQGGRISQDQGGRISQDQGIERVEKVRDKVIESASAFGLSVFKNAKTAFEFSKKKVTEVIEKAKEDRRGAGYSGSEQDWNRPSTFKDYNPGHDQGSYKDDGFAQFADHEEEPEPRLAKESILIQETVQKVTLVEEKIVVAPVANLLDFGDSFISPQPVFATTSSTRPLVNPSMNVNPIAKPVPIPAQPIVNTIVKPIEKPLPKPIQQFNGATPLQLSSSNAAKEQGTDYFKKGQFGDAAAYYTKAIDALPFPVDPSLHSLLIPLLNNRAAANLKTGDYHQVVTDCDRVQELEKNDVKSLLRRATAFEAMEKWEDARKDYRVLMSLDGSIKGVSIGLGRCNQALNKDPQKPETDMFGDPHSGSTSPAKPVSAFVKQAVDAAVDKIRKQNEAIESEEALKLAFKDQVDDKITKWRKGKEDNLRALLCSLDTVLWPELDYKKVGLGELITPQQVKIKYLKAVGKMHPDKVGLDTSVEHRLIANNVFSTLNKAWDAFKTQNNL